MSSTLSAAPAQADPAVPVAAGLPKPEYPRPDRDRSGRWLSLNGGWDFRCEDGDRRITVPFAWETEASGVARTWLEHAVYRRRIAVPASWTPARVMLCFGAVHHRARVLLDGVEVGSHVGGYESFEFDVTDRVPPGTTAELTVEVDAPADKRAIPHGKQRSIPRDDYDGVSFTPTSGIWQSVWLEARGRTYLAGVTLRGDSLTGFDIEGVLTGDAQEHARVSVRVVDGSRNAESVELAPDAAGRVSGRLELADPRLWSPVDPHLYSLEFTTGDGPTADRMTASTGLRRIEARGEQLFLNGIRISLRGVLDQGYWPESGATAPDDKALLRDLELARELGFTLVRKHIKLEEPRWLHHADRLGMLVWAEPPGPSRFSADAVAAFEAQLTSLVERDGNHPSIVVWGLYNEEWGLDWDIPGSSERAEAAAHAYDVMGAMDDSRLIVENSGWAHVRTDLVDWHYYDEDPGSWAEHIAALADGREEGFRVKLGPDFVVDKSLYGSPEHPRSGLPVINSEYGAGATSLERAWHVRWQTQELRRHDRFAGYVYTELADVEHEMAGLVDASRRRKDLGGLHVADVNAETVLVVDLTPLCAGADIEVPVEDLRLDVHVSHHGRESVSGRIRAAWVPAGRPFPAVQADADPAIETDIVVAEPFALTDPVPLRVPPPGSVSSARLHLWLVDDAGDVRARTYLDAAPVERDRNASGYNAIA